MGKSILIKAPNWIGDVLMASFSMAAIKNDNSEVRLTLLIHEKLAPLTKFMPWVDDIRLHDKARGIGDWWQWIRQVKQSNPDAVVLCPNSFKCAALTRMGTSAPLYGLRRQGRGFMLDHAVDTDGELKHAHRSRWYAEICRPLLQKEPTLAPALIVSDQDKASFPVELEPGSRNIAMAVGAAYGPAKEYGQERFSSIIEHLVAQNFKVVIVGTPREKEVGSALAAAFPDSVKNMAGQTTLDEMVILLSKLDGYIGNDSGPMHVSSVLGLPTVGIYGPTDPSWVGPVGPSAASCYANLDCSPCYRRVCPKEDDGHMACMSQITPGKVIETFLELFEGRR